MVKHFKSYWGWLIALFHAPNKIKKEIFLSIEFQKQKLFSIYVGEQQDLKSFCNLSLIQPNPDSGYRFWALKVWPPDSTFLASMLSKTVQNKDFNEKWHSSDCNVRTHSKNIVPKNKVHFIQAKYICLS